MISTLFRRTAGSVLVAVAALFTGCAQVPLGTPVASIDNIQAARAVGMQPVNVGKFELAAGKDPTLDKGLAIRAASVGSPIDGSFAKYLRETLTVELKAAGLFDPTAKTTIEGFLTDSAADAAMSRGTGRLGARFVVVRGGRTVYDKELKVDASWDSSFVGAVAIPAAINEYSALYRKLVAKLLADPAFRAAVTA
ncbi:MAG TPA: hypothetical protein VFA35_10420, partial [Burkholderiaceae bacterium]|nr:hypothetical protein [Burkholderiaceae bacterium]